MSYTNKTPNYSLPQYVADDKPTYLGDFNKAMIDIDTNMKKIDDKSEESKTLAENANATSSQALQNSTQAQEDVANANANAENAKQIAQNAQTDASTAISTANTANSNSQSAINTAETAKTTADNASSTAQSAKTTADSANSLAQSANTNANNALNSLEKFNLNNFQSWSSTQMTPQNGISDIQNSSMNLASDSSGKIFKLYGSIEMTIAKNQTGQVVLSNSNLRPTEEIRILNGGIQYVQNNIDSVDIVIKKDGTINIEAWNGYGGRGKIMLFNSLYFLNAFEQLVIDPSQK